MTTKPTRHQLSLIGLQPTGDLAGLTAYTNRRGRIIWFPKSPPKCPPTDNQIRQRMRWTLIAHAWTQLTQEKRDAWNLACRRAHLYMHGYHLWVWWSSHQYLPTIRTIERQSGITLLPA